ncbi:hypothetical protein CEJ98_11920 [Burkholderia gladioli pv. gladioli]|nr:hypothetical protein CEJ98_11920 [Burkholderia gladioli pv. gladioli]AWY55111.1 hypothetical protein A8H28_29215 [Burkholderia gladioli pv. gladioli]PRH27491.1 hypothetical protein C6V07_33625 [Burkholderia gladioli]
MRAGRASRRRVPNARLVVEYRASRRQYDGISWIRCAGQRIDRPAWPRRSCATAYLRYRGRFASPAFLKWRLGARFDPPTGM